MKNKEVCTSIVCENRECPKSRHQNYVESHCPQYMLRLEYPQFTFRPFLDCKEFKK